jgi:soluble lytic murein transglycosylase-like protein
MGALSHAATALALLGANTFADPVARWHPLIERAARRCGVSASWIAQVMRAESGGRTQLRGSPIVSPKGAMGLMQLMPGTWAELRAAHALGHDPHDPQDNIVAGACYLRQMHDRFGYPGLFAAYNAGPARYAAHLAGRAHLPGETRDYLARITGPSAAPSPARQPASPLFFTLGTANTAAIFVCHAPPEARDRADQSAPGQIDGRPER